jgi:hypothetical protein
MMVAMMLASLFFSLSEREISHFLLNGEKILFTNNITSFNPSRVIVDAITNMIPSYFYLKKQTMNLNRVNGYNETSSSI